MRRSIVALIVITSIGILLLGFFWPQSSKDSLSINRGSRQRSPEIDAMLKRKSELDRLPEGKIVLDAPKSMKLGDTQTIHAAVGINVPIETLRRYMRPDSQIAESKLKVANEMSAVLTGPSFKITPLNPDKQPVADSYPTFWSWNIEPTREGEQTLEATLYVHIPAGSATQQRIDSFTQTIAISVKEKSLFDWIRSSEPVITATNALIAAGTSAVAIAIASIKWIRRRRRGSLARSRQAITPEIDKR